MTEEGDGVTDKRPQGLLASLRTLLATLVAVLYTRLDILVTEVEEEKIRLSRIMLLGIAIVFFSCMALGFFSILIAAVFWNDHRMAVLGGITLVYILLAIVSACWLRLLMKRKSRLFTTSLAELRKDHAGLQT